MAGYSGQYRSMVHRVIDRLRDNDCPEIHWLISKDEIEAAHEELSSESPAPLAWSSDMPQTAGDYVVRREDGWVFPWTYYPNSNDLTFARFAEKGWRWIGPIVVHDPPAASD